VEAPKKVSQNRRLLSMFLQWNGQIVFANTIEDLAGGLIGE
jgi:hypothetical protein